MATIQEVNELTELLKSEPSDEVELLMQEGWETFETDDNAYGAGSGAALFRPWWSCCAVSHCPSEAGASPLPDG